MKQATSCGGIIFRNKAGLIEYLIIKHKEVAGGHWDFPKGHMEKGETEIQTATREIHEETGLKVQFIDGFRESITYINHINNENKTVVFFLARALSHKVKSCDEITDHLWLEYKPALKRLTHENAVNLLEKAHICALKSYFFLKLFDFCFYPCI